MIIPVNVIKSDISGSICVISKSIAEAFSLIPEKISRLRFGQSVTNIALSISDKDRNPSVRISADLFAKLGIPENIKTNITVDGNEIKLGPVLGVFASPGYFRKILRQNPPKSCQHMMKANRDFHLFIYYFTTEGANWLDNKIEGCYYSAEKGAWIKKQVSLPDVVYDRCVYNSGKVIPLADYYREHFTPSGSIKRINSRDHLDKYWLHERLKKHPEIRQYLPHTIKYSSVDDVLDMLKKYNTIYLKSFYGNKGSEVMALSRNRDDTIKCWYFSSSNLVTDNLKDRESLSRLINSFFKNKEFVIQQGINLLQYDGRRMDMRVLIQKDDSGRWLCLYNTAFLGRKDSMITAGEEKGAQPYNFREIMPLILNKPAEYVSSLYNAIGKACIRIAQAIESEYGPFGEIGMDMALDDNLKIWFIEANSKPDRELEPGIIGYARCIACCFNIIKYTKYLSGF